MQQEIEKKSLVKQAFGLMLLGLVFHFMGEAIASPPAGDIESQVAAEHLGPAGPVIAGLGAVLLTVGFVLMIVGLIKG